MWVWSAEPAHEPLIPKWTFDEITAVYWSIKMARVLDLRSIETEAMDDRR